jgi:hypothetical protein
MILSNTDNFLFLKNKKVGSSSVEIFLSQFLDPTKDVWYGERGFGGEPDFPSMNVIGENKDPHIGWEEIKNLYSVPDHVRVYIVERNPYDQYLSMRDYQIAQGHTPYDPKKFFEFNYNIYLSAGNRINVLQYEHLADEIKQMCRIHALPFDINTWRQMKFKSSSRQNETSEFYKKNPDLKEAVENAAWYHFDTLGYEK